MNKKKIILITVSAVALVAIIVTTVIMPLISNSIHKKTSEENPPAQVVDFEEKAEGSIRVITFNIRCTNLGMILRSSRNDEVIETIKKGMPDSFGVQEATPTWMRYLKRELGDLYDYVGVGRANGKNMGEFSAIFYLKDIYEVYDSDTFWLSETPEEPSVGWDASMNRICTWAVLENKETGAMYMHINSHFDHKGTEARKNSVKLILEKTQMYNTLPVVFTADMNIREGDEAYKLMAESKILWDTKKIAPDTMDYLTFHDTVPSENEGRILDYVFINKNFGVTTYKVVTAGIDGRFVSDHYPVYADLVIRE